MSTRKKTSVVEAAEALLAAAKELPDDITATSRADISVALKRWDAAETRCDDAMDEYVESLRNEGAK